jgi:hypothetical protein
MWISYSETYEVSEEGNVRNKMTGLILKACDGGGGYLHLNIHGKSKKVHRMIAERFLPAPTAEGLEIDHIDRDRFNNHASNLRWVTRQVNAQNRGICKINTSGHKCIYKTPSNTFKVHIMSNKTSLYCKTFKTLKEAVEARDKFNAS